MGTRVPQEGQAVVGWVGVCCVRTDMGVGVGMRWRVGFEGMGRGGRAACQWQSADAMDDEKYIAEIVKTRTS